VVEVTDRLDMMEPCHEKQLRESADEIGTYNGNDIFDDNFHLLITRRLPNRPYYKSDQGSFDNPEKSLYIERWFKLL
jgi:hypothetical protein